jgi:hypothetical protein
VLTSVPTATRRFFPGRRSREVKPEPEVSELALTRATVIDTVRVDDEAARDWLREAAADPSQAVVEAALRELNRALRAHRAATADPHVCELSRSQVLVVRVGYGEGMEVADGLWTQARELKPAKRRTRGEAALRPQERLAALLGARDAVLACEDMALRARLDLDHQRYREAALQTHLALEAAISELQAYRSIRDIGQRLADLESRRDAVAAAANEAIHGGLHPETITSIREALEKVEAALRRRAASAAY